MSHRMSIGQKHDAMQNWGVTHFIAMPTDVWSQISAEADSVTPFLKDIKRQLSKEASSGDLLLVQGDFGATYNMVQYAKEIGMVPVYATSVRRAHEIVHGEKVTTIREFVHVQLRKYEG